MRVNKKIDAQMALDYLECKINDLEQRMKAAKEGTLVYIMLESEQCAFMQAKLSLLGVLSEEE